MKKALAIALVLSCLLGLAGCGAEGENTRYFFTGKVLSVEDEYLLLEVTHVGNSALLEGAKVEVSASAADAGSRPEFAAGEYARIVLANNTESAEPGRLEALAIYEAEKTEGSGLRA